MSVNLEQKYYFTYQSQHEGTWAHYMSGPTVNMRQLKSEQARLRKKPNVKKVTEIRPLYVSKT